MKFATFTVLAIGVLAFLSPALARTSPLSTAFTYQGVLVLSGNPVNGTADFQFTLWDALSGGAQVGGPFAVNAVAVANGQFTLSIDFGSNVFNGQARWLQIAARSPAGGGAFTTLSPRQPITAVPYCLQARGMFVDTLSNVGIGTTAPSNRLSVSGNANFTGNVGIGTTSPGEKLTVAGSMEIGTNSGDYQHLRIGGGNSNGFLYGSYPHFGDGIHMGYNYYADASGGNQIVHSDGGTSRLSLGYGTAVIATGAPFAGEPVNRLVVDQNGHIGIGTTSPNWPLHLETSELTTLLAKNNNTSGLANAVVARAESPYGIGVVAIAESTTGTNYGVWGYSYSPTGYDFFAAGPGVNYGSPSSIRWKRNIEPIASSLEMLAQMRGVYFDWDQAHGGRHDVGMIGEEVGKVLPEIVAYEADGQYVTGMDYSRLTPLLVEAVKGLRAEKDAQFEQQQEQITSLQEQNTELKNRLTALEAALSRLINSQENH